MRKIQALKSKHLPLLKEFVGNGREIVMTCIELETEDPVKQIIFQLGNVVKTDVNELKLGGVLESSFADGLNLVHGQFQSPQIGQISKVIVLQ